MTDDAQRGDSFAGARHDLFPDIIVISRMRRTRRAGIGCDFCPTRSTHYNRAIAFELARSSSQCCGIFCQKAEVFLFRNFVGSSAFIKTKFQVACAIQTLGPQPGITTVFRRNAVSEPPWRMLISLSKTSV